MKGICQGNVHYQVNFAIEWVITLTLCSQFREIVVKAERHQLDIILSICMPLQSLQSLQHACPFDCHNGRLLPLQSLQSLQPFYRRLPTRIIELKTRIFIQLLQM